ncbi:MAG: hypothetical protein WBI17_00310 [Clostridiaceae bacterium]
MNTDKILKESKVIMIVTFIVGVLLLATGIAFSLLEATFIKNNRALIGLSLIPLSVGVMYYFKYTQIKKSPNKIKEIIINEIDERIVNLKNEADAKAFKIVQGLIFLLYMGYTLMVPEDIFEAVGWWILLIILFVSFMAQGLITAMAMWKNKSKENQE